MIESLPIPFNHFWWFPFSTDQVTKWHQSNGRLLYRPIMWCLINLLFRIRYRRSLTTLLASPKQLKIWLEESPISNIELKFLSKIWTFGGRYWANKKQLIPVLIGLDRIQLIARKRKVAVDTPKQSRLNLVLLL